MTGSITIGLSADAEHKDLHHLVIWSCEVKSAPKFNLGIGRLPTMSEALADRRTEGAGHDLYQRHHGDEVRERVSRLGVLLTSQVAGTTATP